MFNRGGLGNVMKQAQMIQEKLKKTQEEIKNLEVEGQAAAGLVKVIMTGSHSVRKVVIDPSLKDEELDMLEDLIAAACNDAVTKVEQTSQEKMASVTAGVPLPPGFQNMFGL